MYAGCQSEPSKHPAAYQTFIANWEHVSRNPAPLLSILGSGPNPVVFFRAFAVHRIDIYLATLGVERERVCGA